MSWFVTATDTDAGKTLVSCALLMALVQSGRRAAGMKPVASGCIESPQGLRSADAEALLAAGNVRAGYAEINPYALVPATAPHLAAAAAGVTISVEVIARHYAALASQADAVVVEGVGGWQVPIGPQQYMADVVRALDLPVILVVGLRVGAINHALLTTEAIAVAGCRLAGWVANCIEAQAPEGYVEALCERIGAPLLAVVPHGAAPAAVAGLLSLAAIDV